MTQELAPGLSRIPVPWDVKGQGWIYPIYTPFSKSPIKVPKGTYSEFESGTSFDLSERFHGGVGMVMIVRYLDCPGKDISPSLTPRRPSRIGRFRVELEQAKLIDSVELLLDTAAGAYDELLYIPGLFSKEEKPEEYFLTTTRIYVSTDLSVANGRVEWGIPKHRAEFEFTPLSPDSSKMHLTVSHPTNPPRPFFSAVLTDSKLTPFSMPVSTSWLSWPISRYFMDGYNATLIQPPLPSSLDEPDKARSTLEGTNQTIKAFTGSEGRTLAFSPVSTGWSRLSYLEVRAPEGGSEGGEEDWSGFGDGKGFPRFEVAKEGIISGRGVRLTSFKMHIPAGVVVE
ncbi:hypothetical protein JCM16303_003430 [Sporobolomyces ruberrimus]